MICAGLTFTYTSAGAASYSWTANNPGSFVYTSGGIAVAHPSISSVFTVVGGSLGCASALQTHSITVNPLPVFSIGGNRTLCPGSAIILTAAGTATQYTWSPPTGLNTTTGATVSANSAASQNYLVTGSLNNCTASAAVMVSVAPLPSPSVVNSKPALCLNEFISLQGLGGNSYDWSGPGNFHSTDQNLNFLANNPTYAGNYVLTVTDGNGCKNSASTSILIKQLPDVSVLGNTSGCAPLCTSLELKTGNYEVDWVLPGAQSSDLKNFQHCFEEPGTYNLSINVYDPSTTCSNTTGKLIHVYPKPRADFAYSPDLPVEGLDEVKFTGTAQGDQVDHWSWFIKTNIVNNFTTENAQFLFTDQGVFPVVLVTKNTWGCSDTVIKNISVQPYFNVYVPNSFTPNGDGLNDVFYPVCGGIETYQLEIYDRWGAKIFGSNNPANGWDGLFKGSRVEADSYTSKLMLTGVNGNKRALSGMVTVIY